MNSQSVDVQLVSLLKSADNHYVSGTEIATRLKISRNAIWKHVENLRQNGYKIAATPHLGYKFEASPPNRILAEEVIPYLNTKQIGQEIVVFNSIDSTNRVVMDWGRQNMPEGSVAIAEEQTEGRGRMGRRWESPRGGGLYFSILLKPKLDVREIPKLTLLSAVAIVEALNEASGIDAKIKWPNDILVSNKKICGILSEFSADSDKAAYVVLGIGMNINLSKKKLLSTATSLESLTKKKWNRCQILVSVLNQFSHYYGTLIEGNWNEIARKWNKYSLIQKKRNNRSNNI